MHHCRMDEEEAKCRIERPNQSGSSVLQMSWRTSVLFSALVNLCSLSKIDLWELGPEIAAIRRLSVAVVNCLTLKLQNRTAAGPYSWLSLEPPVRCKTS